MLMHNRSHRIVNWRHNLVGHFNYRHFCTCIMEILGHFKADESATNDHSPTHVMIRHVGFHSISIGYIA